MKHKRYRGLISKEQLEQAMIEGEIDTLIIAICDMQGRLMGKRLTGEYCLRNGLKGTHFCIYLLGTDMEMNTPGGYQLMNWETGYGDWLAQPDWSTLRVVPWLEKTAFVLADPVDERTGERVAVAPRSILKNQLEKAEKMGFRLQMASELEFYLFKQTYEQIHQNGYSVLQTAGHYNEDYNLLQATRNELIYRKIRNWMLEADIPIESSKGEACAGQHEINMQYGDALTAADRHVFFKHGAKEICLQEGYAITFMAKPDHRWTGSSGHLHISLWDVKQEANLFHDPKGTQYGMSELMESFLAGLLAYTREFSLFFASNVNSYKRYAPESWAPVSIVWSRDNRTAGYRIVGDGASLRIECRIPGADMNPYLAYAAMIGAGLQGIQQKLPLPTEFRGNAYKVSGVPRVPGSLYEAMQLWKESRAVREVFGGLVADHYYNMARVEQQAFDAVVTAWERARYFEQG
ncbi:glutamine synthetase family protein [Effusibacillus pohliae]|uniref:glutamine synthetase family protein n=1 Tax=Effusibacillus pohliae TaxID=232270 RepID=UPI0004757049|nr:glutamine synthetase family protein [Effusibacillus pohliae]